MAFDKVVSELERMGILDHLTVRSSTADTVEHAAQIIGCSVAEIAKSMTFEVDGIPVLIVAAGDAKISNSKFKSCFHTKATMLPRDMVETKIGHQPGGVCPFALNAGVKVYLDESLKRFQFVHTSGGKDTATVRLTIPELERYTGYTGWVDVCSLPEGVTA